MKKASKALYCVMLTTIILCACIVPCFAIEVTVEAEGWDDIGYSVFIQTEAPTDYSTAMSEGYFSLAQTEMLIEFAEELYKSNAFGGMRPVLITLTNDEVNGWFVTFWCNSPLLNLPTYNTISAIMGTRTENHELPFTLPNYYNNRQLRSFQVRKNGSVSQMTATYTVTIYEAQHIPSSQTNYASWYYAYFNGSEWVYDEDDVFCACSEMDTADYGTAVEEYQYALDQWKNANRGTTEVETTIKEEVQYQLDIPAIITAIPNGAKQIINNAFGFEIFGINVAGLLSVLLVVTIVAFVVKWLMSR